MPTIRYRLSTRTSNGSAEVLVRFYDGKFSQRAKTRVAIPTDAWNAEVGGIEVPRRVTPENVSLREKQRTLEALADYISKSWWRDRFNLTHDWLQNVIDEFHGISQDVEVTSRMRMVDCIKECAESKDLAKRSIDQYKILSNVMERYEVHVHRTIYTDSFSKSDVDEFVRFYTNEDKTRARNTITARLKKLSAVCLYAVAKGYMRESPFGNGKYKIKSEVYGDPIFLSIAERNSLYKFDGLPERLAVQRDIFIFQCHVGCRIGDLMELTYDNVTDDGFLQYIQHKLRRSNPTIVRVPLSNTAREIIERYMDASRGRLLPFINMERYNVLIHEIFRLAGMNRIVMVQDPRTLKAVPRQLWEVASSHLARRTFMANMFKETKSERITSAFTGHVDGSRAFGRYTKVDDEMKLEVMKNMRERD